MGMPAPDGDQGIADDLLPARGVSQRFRALTSSSRFLKEMTAYYFSRPAANYEIAEETNRQA